MMLKQSPNRIQRSKGFKVKHFLQICLLLAICIWLLNQFKRTYDSKNGYKDSLGKISEKVQGKNEIIKLGRKDIHPRADETALEIESQVGKAEMEQEIEEIKPEDVEDGERGDGDDEIDGRDQERAEEEESEEVEDLIDVDDRVTSEEQESEEKSSRLKETSNHQSRTEGKRISRQAREEHYKGDYGFSSMNRRTRILSSEFSELGGLRKMRMALGLSHHGNVQDDERGYKFSLGNSSFSAESG